MTCKEEDLDTTGYTMGDQCTKTREPYIDFKLDTTLTFYIWSKVSETYSFLTFYRVTKNTTNVQFYWSKPYIPSLFCNDFN